jgi:hypothetical protein
MEAVLSWSFDSWTGFDISITRFGIEATSNSIPCSPDLPLADRPDRPFASAILSSSVAEEPSREWETRWCRRRGPINQSGRETRGGPTHGQCERKQGRKARELAGVQGAGQRPSQGLWWQIRRICPYLLEALNSRDANAVPPPGPRPGRIG